MLVTAESLTDEQIREYLAIALDRGNGEAARLAQIALWTWHCAHAWQATDRDYTPACHICGDHYDNVTCDNTSVAPSFCICPP